MGTVIILPGKLKSVTKSMVRALLYIGIAHLFSLSFSMISGIMCESRGQGSIIFNHSNYLSIYESF